MTLSTYHRVIISHLQMLIQLTKARLHYHKLTFYYYLIANWLVIIFLFYFYELYKRQLKANVRGLNFSIFLRLKNFLHFSYSPPSIMSIDILSLCIATHTICTSQGCVEIFPLPRYKQQDGLMLVR